MRKDAAKTPLPSRAERREFLEQQLRERTREWIEVMVNEELDVALGLGRYERGAERRGYRKGKRRRNFTTGTGRHELAMPRGEYFDPGPDGTKQWHSQLIPRYARRTAEVEDALVKSYLSGTNTRRIKRALSPLLAGAALSKSTISRVVAGHGELKRDYRTIITKKNLETARVTQKPFLRKWKTLVPAVARSLEEAGDDLLTFYHFPKSQWKCLRTTNPIERINEEFRRRTKTSERSLPKVPH